MIVDIQTSTIYFWHIYSMFNIVWRCLTKLCLYYWRPSFVFWASPRSVNYILVFNNTTLQDGVDADKPQAPEKTQRSRALLGRTAGVNGVVNDQIQVFLRHLFFNQQYLVECF
jgi:hypothetical protein